MCTTECMPSVRDSWQACWKHDPCRLLTNHSGTSFAVPDDAVSSGRFELKLIKRRLASMYSSDTLGFRNIVEYNEKSLKDMLWHGEDRSCEDAKCRATLQRGARFCSMCVFVQDANPQALGSSWAFQFSSPLGFLPATGVASSSASHTPRWRSRRRHLA